jgi:hypothetical protein
MSPRSAGSFVVATLLTAAAACNLDTSPADIFEGALVTGRIESEAGAGVPGTLVRLGFAPDSICGPLFDETAGTLVTDSVGGYSAILGARGAPQAVCVRLIATPPAPSGLAVDTAGAMHVAFTENPEQSTVRIDLVLPPK